MLFPIIVDEGVNISRATELRKRQSVAGVVHTNSCTSPFNPREPQYSNDMDFAAQPNR